MSRSLTFVIMLAFRVFCPSCPRGRTQPLLSRASLSATPVHKSLCPYYSFAPSPRHSAPTKVFHVSVPWPYIVISILLAVSVVPRQDQYDKELVQQKLSKVDHYNSDT